jgi:hypothetical protein
VDDDDAFDLVRRGQRVPALEHEVSNVLGRSTPEPAEDMFVVRSPEVAGVGRQVVEDRLAAGAPDQKT